MGVLFYRGVILELDVLDQLAVFQPGVLGAVVGQAGAGDLGTILLSFSVSLLGIG